MILISIRWFVPRIPIGLELGVVSSDVELSLFVADEPEVPDALPDPALGAFPVEVEGDVDVALVDVVESLSSTGGGGLYVIARRSTSIL